EDRLCRATKLEHLGIYTDLDDLKVKIYTSDGRPFSPGEDNILRAIKGIVAGDEKRLIVKRAHAGKESARKNGKLANSKVVLPTGVGYDDTKGYFYNEKSWLVKQIFDLFYYQNVTSYSEIARKMGVANATVKNILKNKLYIGVREYKYKRGDERYHKPDGRRGDKKKVLRSPDEAFILTVINEPLIDPHIFNEVQKIIEEKGRSISRAERGSRFLYTEFLRCKYCGNKIYGTLGGRKGKKSYYLCCSKTKQFKDKYGDMECKLRYIPQSDMENTLETFICEKLTDANFLSEVLSSSVCSDQAKFESDINDLENNLQAKNNQRQKLLDLYTENLLPKELLNEKAVQLNSEIDRLQTRMDDIKTRAREQERLDIYKLAEMMGQVFSEFEFLKSEEKKAILKQTIPKIYISNDGVEGCRFGIGKLITRTGKDSRLLSG
ncbi:MAG: recombinase family protein, partial [Desulfobacteraceae bacterium]|nr:recombinase family protein [Desulfobacteraceae bacterium]